MNCIYVSQVDDLTNLEVIFVATIETFISRNMFREASQRIQHECLAMKVGMEDDRG